MGVGPHRKSLLVHPLDCWTSWPQQSPARRNGKVPPSVVHHMVGSRPAPTKTLKMTMVVLPLKPRTLMMLLTPSLV